MKFSKIFLMGALAASFAACDEPAPSVPPVQSNPQEPVIKLDAVSGAAAGAFADGATINLADAAASEIEMFTASVTDTLPESASLNFSCEVASAEDFGTFYKVPVEYADGMGAASVKGLDDALVAFYGAEQTPRDLYYRVIPYVTVGGTNYRLGTDPMVSGMFSAVCTDWAGYVSPNYYMLGDATTWDLSDAAEYPMTKQGGSYVYNITVNADKSVYWKIATDFAVDYKTWQGVMCFDPADFGVGTTTMVFGDKGAGCLAEEGTYRINFNPATREVNVRKLPGFLYTPGDANGWSQAASQFVYYNDYQGANIGAILASGSFKLCSKPNWEGTNWGLGAEAGTLSTDGGAGNLPVEVNGLNWIKANTADLTYVLTPVTSVGVVGAFNEWKETAPVELVANEDGTVWSGEVALSGEWKIVLNHSWDCSYGGDINDMVVSGDNFKGYDGTYAVAMDFSGNAPVLKLTAK